MLTIKQYKLYRKYITKDRTLLRKKERYIKKNIHRFNTAYDTLWSIYDLSKVLQ